MSLKLSSRKMAKVYIDRLAIEGLREDTRRGVTALFLHGEILLFEVFRHAFIEPFTMARCVGDIDRLLSLFEEAVRWALWGNLLSPAIDHLLLRGRRVDSGCVFH